MRYKRAQYAKWRQLNKHDKPNTLVVFALPKAYKAYATGYPFEEGDVVLYLGEVENMPSHVIVATKKPPFVTWGYHFELFRVIPGDET